MTTKFKEIDLTKEFEVNEHEVELDTSVETITLTCRFCYYPSSSEVFEVSGKVMNWKRDAHVDLIEVKDHEKDLFDLLSESTISKIEQEILEDLME